MNGMTVIIKCLKSSCSFTKYVHSFSCPWTKTTGCFSWKYRVKPRLETLLNPGRSLIREAHRNTKERIGGRILRSKLHFDISFSFPSLLCSTHVCRKTGEPFIFHWDPYWHYGNISQSRECQRPRCPLPQYQPNNPFSHGWINFRAIHGGIRVQTQITVVLSGELLRHILPSNH